jgi:hypothetical protein
MLLLDFALVHVGNHISSVILCTLQWVCYILECFCPATVSQHLRIAGHWQAARNSTVDQALKKPWPEASRRKAHWDFVLEEMAWMANDFMQVPEF